MGGWHSPHQLTHRTSRGRGRLLSLPRAPSPSSPLPPILSILAGTPGPRRPPHQRGQEGGDGRRPGQGAHTGRGAGRRPALPDALNVRAYAANIVELKNKRLISAVDALN